MVESTKYRAVVGFDFLPEPKINDFDFELKSKINVLRDFTKSPKIHLHGPLSGLYCNLELLINAIDVAGYSDGSIIAISTDHFSKFAKEIWQSRDTATPFLEFKSSIKCCPASIHDNWKLIGLDIVDCWLNQIGWHLIPNLESVLEGSKLSRGILPNDDVAERVYSLAKQYFKNRLPLFICGVFEVTFEA